MSGPKSSRYTLTPEQRQRILEEQRRQRELEQERKRVEAERQKKQGLLNEINGELEKVASQIERMRYLQEESGYDLPLSDEAEKNIAELRKQLSTIQNGKASTSAEIKSQNDQLSSILRKATSQYAVCADQIAKATDRFRKELDDRIAEGFHLSFANLGADKRKKDDRCIR